MPLRAFRSAERFTSAQLSELFTHAYTGYFVPVHIDAAGFEAMVAASDLDLSASRVCVLDEAAVAIALLGIRGQRGWIGGMGVVPEYRDQGLGAAVMKSVIAPARRRRLRSIDLEVLTQNEPAIRVYTALGFHRRRTLDIWMRDANATFPMPPRHPVTPLVAADCLAAYDELHAITAPWQRDLTSLRHSLASLQALGIVEDGRITAYVLYRMDNVSVRIADVAAAPGQSSAMIESTLRALIRQRAGSPIRFINLPHDDPASPVMYHIGARVEMQQYEMTLEL